MPTCKLKWDGSVLYDASRQKDKYCWSIAIRVFNNEDITAPFCSLVLHTEMHSFCLFFFLVRWPSFMPYLKQNIKQVSKANLICPVGFINKCNTCCANSILQVLRVMPSLWNSVPSEFNHLSPMLPAISLSMAVKKNSIKPVNPSNFLWALKRNLSSKRVAPFDFNSQQHMAEILQVVLDEHKGISLAASSLISNKLRTTVSCNTCICSSASEENLDTLSLEVSTDIQTSLKTFLSPEILSSWNK